MAKRTRPKQTPANVAEEIRLPLTAAELTATTFFATQQLLVNLAALTDPQLLVTDLAETLGCDRGLLENLRVGTWDDNLLASLVGEGTERPEPTLLGLARHLSDLTGRLSGVVEERRRLRERPSKGNVHLPPARKAQRRATPADLASVPTLPQNLSYAHKGRTYVLLGREVDRHLGLVPEAAMTAGELVTCKELLRQAQARANEPERPTDEAFLATPEGKRAAREAELLDVDLSFNLSLRQCAVLLRRPREALPAEVARREAFITERARLFADLPAWVVLEVRGFFLTRLLSSSSTR